MISIKDNDSSSSKDSAILLSKSLDAYNIDDYDQCIDCLRQLSSNSNNNSCNNSSSSSSIANDSIIQIKYNLLLAEHYKSSSSSSSSSATALSNKLEHLLLTQANTNDINGKDNSNNDDNTTTNSDTINGLILSINSTTSTALYSLSSLYYHHHNYSSCCIILEKIFAYMSTDRFDIGLFIKVSFLLIEVYLTLWKLSDDNADDYRVKLFNILASIDNCRPSLLEGVNIINNNSNSKAYNDNVLPRISSKVLLGYIITLRIHSYRCRVLAFLRRIESAKAEWNNAMELYEDMFEPLLSTSFELEGINDLSVVLLSYLGCRKNTSSNEQNVFVKKQIVEEMSLISSIKAHIEYLLEDYDNIRGLVNNNISIGYVELNNIACTYMKDKKYQIAVLYFKRALEQLENTTTTTNNDNDITISQNYSNEIIHNCGLSLLIIDQPKEAFKYFKKVSASFQNKGKYWIRMAECCIRYNMINKEEEDYRGGSNPVIQTIVSKGRSRRLIVRPNSSYSETIEKNDDDRDNDMLNDLTLKKSIEYLHKALEIIDKSNNEKSISFNNDIEEPTWALEKDFKMSSPMKLNNSINEKVKENHRLRYIVLTKLAYVHLCLKEPKLALDTCMLVLSSSLVSGETKFLSRMYCVEALCSLGHPDEAIKKLEEDLKGECLHDSQIPPSWTLRPCPLTVDVLSRLIFQVNYAASLALKDELDGAQKILEMIVEKVPSFVPAFRGLIYVYLRQGNYKNASKLFDFHRLINI